MTATPRHRSLRIEDIDPEDTDASFRKIIGFLGRMMETQSDALQNGITFQENIASLFKQLDITTKSNYESVGSPRESEFPEINIQHGLRERAVSVWIIQAFRVGDLFGVTSGQAIYPDWFDNGEGSVVIKHIAGLQNTTQYTITFLIL